MRRSDSENGGLMVVAWTILRAVMGLPQPRTPVPVRVVASRRWPAEHVPRPTTHQM
ncbi:MAG TPA: hypothetical protein VIR16_08060 [Candidatus Limnocylindrales bacterium]